MDSTSGHTVTLPNSWSFMRPHAPRLPDESAAHTSNVAKSAEGREVRHQNHTRITFQRLHFSQVNAIYQEIQIMWQRSHDVTWAISTYLTVFLQKYYGPVVNFKLAMIFQTAHLWKRSWHSLGKLLKMMFRGQYPNISHVVYNLGCEGWLVILPLCTDS